MDVGEASVVNNRDSICPQYLIGYGDVAEVKEIGWNPQLPIY